MSSGSGGERGKTLEGIVQSLHHSEELEAWGLMVEAAEEFQRQADEHLLSSQQIACLFYEHI